MDDVDSEDDALDNGVEPLRKRALFVAVVCVGPGDDSEEVNTVDVMGCDIRLWRLCIPTSCCCCCRLRCKADDEEELPTSAVLPKEDTSPIAANRKTNIVAAIGKYIGLPLH